MYLAIKYFIKYVQKRNINIRVFEKFLLYRSVIYLRTMKEIRFFVTDKIFTKKVCNKDFRKIYIFDFNTLNFLWLNFFEKKIVEIVAKYISKICPYF